MASNKICATENTEEAQISIDSVENSASALSSGLDDSVSESENTYLQSPYSLQSDISILHENVFNKDSNIVSKSLVQEGSSAHISENTIVESVICNTDQQCTDLLISDSYRTEDLYSCSDMTVSNEGKQIVIAEVSLNKSDILSFSLPEESSVVEQHCEIAYKKLDNLVNSPACVNINTQCVLANSSKCSSLPLAQLHEFFDNVFETKETMPSSDSQQHHLFKLADSEAVSADQCFDRLVTIDISEGDLFEETESTTFTAAVKSNADDSRQYFLVEPYIRNRATDEVVSERGDSDDTENIGNLVIINTEGYSENKKTVVDSGNTETVGGPADIKSEGDSVAVTNEVDSEDTKDEPDTYHKTNVEDFIPVNHETEYEVANDGKLLVEVKEDDIRQLVANTQGLSSPCITFDSSASLIVDKNDICTQSLVCSEGADDEMAVHVEDADAELSTTVRDEETDTEASAVVYKVETDLVSSSSLLICEETVDNFSLIISEEKSDDALLSAESCEEKTDVLLSVIYKREACGNYLPSAVCHNESADCCDKEADSRLLPFITDTFTPDSEPSSDNKLGNKVATHFEKLSFDFKDELSGDELISETTDAILSTSFAVNENVNAGSKLIVTVSEEEAEAKLVPTEVCEKNVYTQLSVENLKEAEKGKDKSDGELSAERENEVSFGELTAEKMKEESDGELSAEKAKDESDDELSAERGKEECDGELSAEKTNEESDDELSAGRVKEESDGELSAEKAKEESDDELSAERGKEESDGELSAEKAKEERDYELSAERGKEESDGELSAEKGKEENDDELSAERVKEESDGELSAEKAKEESDDELSAERGKEESDGELSAEKAKEESDDEFSAEIGKKESDAELSAKKAKEESDDELSAERGKEECDGELSAEKTNEESDDELSAERGKGESDGELSAEKAKEESDDELSAERRNEESDGELSADTRDGGFSANNGEEESESDGELLVERQNEESDRELSFAERMVQIDGELTAENEENDGKISTEGGKEGHDGELLTEGLKEECDGELLTKRLQEESDGILLTERWEEEGVGELLTERWKVGCDGELLYDKGKEGSDGALSAEKEKVQSEGELSAQRGKEESDGELSSSSSSSLASEEDIENPSHTSQETDFKTTINKDELDTESAFFSTTDSHLLTVSQEETVSDMSYLISLTDDEIPASAIGKEDTDTDTSASIVSKDESEDDLSDAIIRKEEIDTDFLTSDVIEEEADAELLGSIIWKDKTDDIISASIICKDKTDYDVSDSTVSKDKINDYASVSNISTDKINDALSDAIITKQDSDDELAISYKDGACKFKIRDKLPTPFVNKQNTDVDFPASPVAACLPDELVVLDHSCEDTIEAAISLVINKTELHESLPLSDTDGSVDEAYEMSATVPENLSKITSFDKHNSGSDEFSETVINFYKADTVEPSKSTVDGIVMVSQSKTDHDITASKVITSCRSDTVKSGSDLEEVSLSDIAENELSREDDVEDTDYAAVLCSGSPMLRRSRHRDSDSKKKDCRLIFNDESDELLDQDSSEQSPGTEEQKYKSLRDSLDIVKNRKLHIDAVLMENSTCNFESGSEDEAQKRSSKVAESSPGKTVAYKKKKVSMMRDRNICKGRRVSFPEDEARLITSYLEPVDPWHHMNNVTTDGIAEAYQAACKRHNVRVLPQVLQQIAALPLGIGGRIERLSLKTSKLEAGQVECLEEIFRRVQFKTLDFEECGLDDDTAIPLLDMIEFYDSTIHLTLASNTKIGNRGWQACAKLLKKTPSLRTLDARNTNLSEQNMPALCRALRIGTTLHTLHLENCNLTGRPLVNLAGALRQNESITDLYLADNRLGVNDCIQIGNLVRDNKTLKILDLRNNNIQDPGCSHICKDIMERQNLLRTKLSDMDDATSDAGLRTLNFWNNHLTVSSIPHISSMLYNNCTLETLNLGKNCFTSDGMILLKNSLMRNRSLIRLGLQATRIGNEGTVALAEYIADNPVIERIDLRENNIQVAGLMALSRSLEMNSNVVQLDIDTNPRAERQPELVTQHISLQQEIKSLCNRNLANSYKNATQQPKYLEADNSNGQSSPESRKISLTCEPSTFILEEDNQQLGLSTGETKRYRSPEPSPSVSPCPSPCPSPSLSPMPSPLKNRFKVFKVDERTSVTSSSYAALSTSAPAAMSMSHLLSGSLPSLVTPAKPNRFLTGKRFTVTKVSDPSVPFISSLPANRAMSSPSLISSECTDAMGPTVVVSSPNSPVRGFSIGNSPVEISVIKDKFEDKCGKERSNSLDFGTNLAVHVDSPTSDDVFESDSGPTVTVARPLNPLAERRQGVYQSSYISAPPAKAPLAAVEAGSFDSDSEDSEVMTQSSDSTHSDEITVSSAEQIEPKLAWESNQEKEVCEIETTNIGDVTCNNCG